MSLERRKVRVGRVVTDEMDKTVVVAVEWRKRHRLYKKSVRRRTRFKAHDEGNMSKVGDLVRIIETRPLSKTKRWRVAEIVARRDIAEIQPEEIAADEPVASVAEPLLVAPAQPELAPAEAEAVVEAEEVEVAEEVEEEAPRAEAEAVVETEEVEEVVPRAEAEAVIEPRRWRWRRKKRPGQRQRLKQ